MASIALISETNWPALSRSRMASRPATYRITASAIADSSCTSDEDIALVVSTLTLSRQLRAAMLGERAAPSPARRRSSPPAAPEIACSAICDISDTEPWMPALMRR